MTNYQYEDDRNDSAFCEPEYSNPASFESSESHNDYQNNIVARRMLQLHMNDNLKDDDLIPDYEEVAPDQLQRLRQSLRKSTNTLWTHAASVLTQKQPLINNNTDRHADNKDSTKERIMQSLIYCIHKVSIIITIIITCYYHYVFSNQARHR